MPDISSITLLDEITYNLRDTRAALATDSSTGTVKPDGTTITIDSNGTITAVKQGMVILSYGSSTWNDFITAYQGNLVVYCRASSNSNPASGSKTRMAFMAYVNNEADPTEVEFQYYRSIATHSETQQGDQVYVYKLNKSSGWGVTTREAYTKIAAGTGLSQSYASGTLTLTASIPSASSATPSMDGTAAVGTSTDYARADHVHPTDTSRQEVLVSGTSIKTVNGNSLLGSGDITITGGLTGVTLDTSVEPYELPIINGKATVDIGNGLTVSDSSGVELKHSTAAGYKHIPTGGSSGQFLGYSSSGTASWQTPPVTSVNGGTGAVSLSASDVGAQATLVSGTNIKTVNNESLLGSGNITIQGGGTETATATLTTAGWSNRTQTVTVQGVTTSNTVIVSCDPNSIEAYTTAGVYCSAQSSNALTFTCTIPPTVNITVNVVIAE